MTLHNLTDIIHNQAQFDSIEDYLACLKQLELDNRESGKEATAEDYKAMHEIIYEIWGVLLLERNK